LVGEYLKKLGKRKLAENQLIKRNKNDGGCSFSYRKSGG
jgi:hypothetical protein